MLTRGKARALREARLRLYAANAGTGYMPPEYCRAPAPAARAARPRPAALTPRRLEL